MDTIKLAFGGHRFRQVNSKFKIFDCCGDLLPKSLPKSNLSVLHDTLCILLGLDD